MKTRNSFQAFGASRMPVQIFNVTDLRREERDTFLHHGHHFTPRREIEPEGIMASAPDTAPNFQPSVESATP
jgi:hypothetical protein